MKFGFFKKKKERDISSRQENLPCETETPENCSGTDEVGSEEVGSELVIYNSDVAAPCEKNVKKEKKGKNKSDAEDFSAFYRLAELLNEPIGQVKDECCMFQVKNLMSRLTKAIVRYNVPDAELTKILYNCNQLNVKELLVSPAYVPSCVRQAKKSGLSFLYAGAAIDFPFGESTFKSKLTDAKNCLAAGVDGVTVIMPAMLLEKDRYKELCRETRKIGRLYKKDAGIAFACAELSAEQIKTAVKTVEKSKAGFITFIFGDADGKTIKEKTDAINKCRGKKPIKIMGNVSTPEAVMQLIKLGAEEIVTPFADEIGKELVKRFRIKSLKLR